MEKVSMNFTGTHWYISISVLCAIALQPLFPRAIAQTKSQDSPAIPINIRVLVLNYDPFFEGKRLHDVLNFNDPRELTKGYIQDLQEATGGLVRFQIVEWRDLDEIYAREDGQRYEVGQYVRNRRAGGGWPEKFMADYPRLLAEQKVVPLINEAIIDEVWIFGDHYFGVWEASMAGPGAFFINGGVYPHVPSLRPFAFYGFNYERGVAEMLHNTSHRTEATLNRVYGKWNLKSPSNNWERFSANVEQSNGVAGVGTCHWPPNASQDYDYGNTRTVMSWADDFLNYPDLTGKRLSVNKSTWCPDGKDPHRSYMRWYFQHIPKADGVNSDGRLNNWLRYIFDFQNYDQLGQPDPPKSYVVKCVRRDGMTAVMLGFQSAYGVDTRQLTPDAVGLVDDTGKRIDASRIFRYKKKSGTYCTATYVFKDSVGKRNRFVVRLKNSNVRDLAGREFAESQWQMDQVEQAWMATPLPFGRNTQREVASWVLKVNGRLMLKGSDRWIERIEELPANGPLLVVKVSLWKGDGKADPIQPEDVLPLVNLTELEELQLRGQSLGDSVIRALTELKNLQVLNLHACGISDESLPLLAQISQLRVLDVGYSKRRITDKGAASLADLHTLEELNIYSSAITDSTLQTLTKLSRLKRIEVTATDVTESGIEYLKSKIPDCNVVYHD